MPTQAKSLLIASGFGCFAALMSTVIISQTHFSRAQQTRAEALEARIDVLEARFFEQLDQQIAFVIEQGRLMSGDIESALGQRIADAETGLGHLIAEGTAATGSRIAGTNSRVARIDAVYSKLLAEQQKRTLDSLYDDTGLADKEREAGGLFRAGKYAAASALYTVVADARPENAEARFYQLYSLFLSNKLDRGNYRRIQEGMLALERNGYQRAEIRSVLEYIAAEEAGMAGRTGGDE